jgi:hypothetical protein
VRNKTFNGRSHRPSFRSRQETNERTKKEYNNNIKGPKNTPKDQQEEEKKRNDEDDDDTGWRHSRTESRRLDSRTVQAHMYTVGAKEQLLPSFLRFLSAARRCCD